jgi:hypothetical protein
MTVSIRKVMSSSEPRNPDPGSSEYGSATLQLHHLCIGVDYRDGFFREREKGEDLANEQH